MPRTVIAVVGAGECDERVTAVAYEVGRLIAEGEGVLVTGGLTGVMEGASRGAHEAGGLVLGILPGLDTDTANRSVDIAIPTGMGELRNGLVVTSSQAVIAIDGEWGTLSEIGFALKLGIPVVGLNTWQVSSAGVLRNAIVRVDTVAEAVEKAFRLATSRKNAT